jgi:hypothetical protein
VPYTVSRSPALSAMTDCAGQQRRERRTVGGLEGDKAVWARGNSSDGKV